MGIFSHGYSQDTLLTNEGMADHLWDMFFEPIKRWKLFSKFIINEFCFNALINSSHFRYLLSTSLLKRWVSTLPILV
uniref:Uncharacterized protein n=1 Tax=Escherichia coli TaxID=562 RepID=A8CFI0_ECOLX|nr:hypothetical protein [Escherichia coli]